MPNGVVAGDVTNHFLLAGVGADTIDPNAKLSYTNEYTLGVEQELMPITSLGGRYAYRIIGRVLEDVGAFPRWWPMASVSRARAASNTF
jgi:hypothetical protein